MSRGGHAYTPHDISDDTDGSRIQQVFLDYCAEANIDFQGTYYEPPIRRRMV